MVFCSCEILSPPHPLQWVSTLIYNRDKAQGKKVIAIFAMFDNGEGGGDWSQFRRQQNSVLFFIIVYYGSNLNYLNVHICMRYSTYMSAVISVLF
jgi:hypothetical protein